MAKERTAALDDSELKWIAKGTQFKTPEPAYKALNSQVVVDREWLDSCVAASNALIDGFVYLDEA